MSETSSFPSEPLALRDNTIVGTSGEDVLYNGEIITSATDEIIEDGTVRITKSADGDFYVVQAFTDASYGTVIGRIDDRFAGVFGLVGRNDAVDLPQDNATFSGSYRGLHRDDPENLAGGIRYIVNGDVMLTADFENESLSGVISNRIGRNPNGTGSRFSYGDVLIDAAEIADDGTFVGTTQGGDSYSNGTTALDGTFTGLFAGETANEVVGQLRFKTESAYLKGVNPSNPIESIETGVFLATKDE